MILRRIRVHARHFPSHRHLPVPIGHHVRISARSLANVSGSSIDPQLVVKSLLGRPLLTGVGYFASTVAMSAFVLTIPDLSMVPWQAKLLTGFISCTIRACECLNL